MTVIDPTFGSLPSYNMWINGLTKQPVQGFPPVGWDQGSDGAYYPFGMLVPSSSLRTTIGPVVVFPPPLPASVYLNIRMNIGVIPAPEDVRMAISMSVYPAVPTFAPVTQSVPTSLTINPIPLPLQKGIITAIGLLLSGTIENYFDDDRQLKTLLNFGNDYQALLTAWQYDPRDITNTSIIVKLYEPLPDDVAVKRQAWISRELSPPVVDLLYTKYTPSPPILTYLRPPNRTITVTGQSGTTVQNATLATLLSTSSLAPIKPSDPIIEEWYTHDFNSTELNIDYSDYSNFVFFSSAVGRLNAFLQKLLILENYNSVLNTNSASLSGTGSAYITGSLAYASLQAIGDKRIEMIRSFDPYERFLYYDSEQPYSSSFDQDGNYQDEMYYNPDCTYPKISGSVVPVLSASVWINTQLPIAQEYDLQNQNYLANTLPAYLREDIESTEFITFLQMIGHQFDILKTYIDASTNIYDRDSNPNIEMSQDIVWDVAQSFGIDLPNQYAINALLDYTIGNQNNPPPKVYREFAAETWKRFFHNQIFMMKTKGTKTSLRTLCNVYGILPTTLQIRESSTPGVADPTGSFENYEEQTNALNITSGAYIQIPWTATTALTASTVEVRFSTTNPTPSVLLDASSQWGLQIQPLTGSYGQLVLTNGIVSSVSSSAMQLFSGNFYSVMLRYSPSGVTLEVKRTDGAENIVEESISIEATPSVAALWQQPNNLYVSSPTVFFGTPFSGLIDEVRVWGEALTDEIFDYHVKYPGLYNGNSIYSPMTDLYARLSFNKPQNLFATTSLANESPYVRQSTSSPYLQYFTAGGFNNIPTYPMNMDIITRNIVRYAPNAGGNQYSTNKVTIAPPSVFEPVPGTTAIVLSQNNSVVLQSTKTENTRAANTIGFFFSLTDAINDSIIRTFGNINLQDLIGDPVDAYNDHYPALQELDALYWSAYAYTFNINQFITFVNNLLGPLFSQARNLVPVRAKLLSGIVHEPTILERNKQPNKQIEVTAGNFTRPRRNNTTYNLEADPVYSSPDMVSGLTEYQTTELAVTRSMDTTADIEYQNAYLFASSSYDILSDLESYSATIVESDITIIASDLESYTSEINLDEITNFGADVEYYDDSTNLFAYKASLLTYFGVLSTDQLSPSQQVQYTNLILGYQSTLTIDTNEIFTDSKALVTATVSTSTTYVIPTINPYTDFTNVEAYTYFSNIYGIVQTYETDFVRVNNVVLNDRGTWQPQTIYNRNDVVYQLGASGSNDPGNNLEYVCVTMQNPFVSYIEPYLDTANWNQVQYIPVTVMVPKLAVLISGSVSLVPITSSLTPIVTGYRPTHFVYTRDYRLRVINGQYLGCKQTDDTTVDGNPVVQVFASAGSTLVVNNNGTPIQQSSNQAGPILDVNG